MATYSITQFKERLYSEKFTIAQLHQMLSCQHISNISAEKLELIKEYLKGKTMSESFLPKTTANTITMPQSSSQYPPITDPDTSDFGVAKKFLQVYNSAKERNIEFSLSLSDVKALIKKKKCHYTDLPFDYSDREKSLTFDRINCNIGYVKGNVVACRYDVNQLKNILIEHEVSVFKNNPRLLLKCVKKWDVN